MWSKPTQSCAGTARPLRVAYLIDPANCTDKLLDAIFAEAYGRWGGPRAREPGEAPVGYGADAFVPSSRSNPDTGYGVGFSVPDAAFSSVYE